MRLLAAFLLLLGCAQAAATTFVAPDGNICAKGRVLVGAAPGIDVARQAGGKARALGAGSHVVEVPSGSEQATVARLRRNPVFAFAELDCRATPDLVPNDPGIGWHLGTIGAASAWDASTGAGMVIAILDSGIDCAHPDLVCVSGWNFVNDNADTSDVWGHGTKVAGTAAAVVNNAIGVAGVAGHARVMPVRVSDSSGIAYWSDMAAGLTWATDRGARVANMSFGSISSSATVMNAAKYLRDRGGLAFSSAGNSNADPGYAEVPQLIVVAATDSSDAKAGFSSFGNFVRLSAPGVAISTTTWWQAYATVNGTSFSAPIVAGVAALVMSANPGLTNSQVESILFSTAVDLGAAGRDPYFGYGRVDAAAAVAAAGVVVPPPPPPPPPPSPTDTTPPAVVIASPLDGARLGQNVRINASASDASGIASMSVAIDGQVRATSSAGSIYFTWNVKKIAAGAHTITVRAVDKAGNSAAASITVSK
jgi:thermitase